MHDKSSEVGKEVKGEAHNGGAGPLGLPVFPGRMPVIGHLYQYFFDMSSTLQRMSSEFGPLCWFDEPGQGMVLVCTESSAFDLFTNPNMSVEHFKEHMGPLHGKDASLVTDGEPHRRVRRATSHPFSPRGLSVTGVAKLIAAATQQGVSKILAMKRFNAIDESRNIALRVIFDLIGIQAQDFDIWKRKYSQVIVGSFGPSIGIFPFPRWWAVRAAGWIDLYLKDQILNIRKTGKGAGLLEILTNGRNGAPAVLSDQEIVDSVRFFLVAGHETTATMMTWMMAYLANMPEVHRQVEQEILQLGRVPMSIDDLKELPVTEALFREVLRLHPPLSSTSRLVKRETTISGVTVPPGTIVKIPILILGMDPDFYPEPELFKLERWLNIERKLQPFETATFGGGAHFCIGYYMARLSVAQFVSELVLGLQKQKKRLTFPKGMPRESYLPLLRPARRDSWCEVVLL